MSSITVIITAGGIGKRMKSTLPKQFLLINEKPVLMHTIEQFYKFDPSSQLIVTLPEDWLDYWEALCVELNFSIQHRVVSGGKERYHSIKNALRYSQHDLIAVHDGVRPLVSNEVLERVFSEAKKAAAVIPVIPVNESMRHVKEGKSSVVDRDQFVIVQTPQVFKQEVLRAAYEQEFHEGVTDDAGLVEASGVEIELVEGNTENIKITNQSDLKYAEMFLK